MTQKEHAVALLMETRRDATSVAEAYHDSLPNRMAGLTLKDTLEFYVARVANIDAAIAWVKHQKEDVVMPRKKASGIQEWVVPMRCVFDGHAFVEAATHEEAMAMCQKGEGSFVDTEMVDWEVTGKARKNT
jgi:hypothetical protein